MNFIGAGYYDLSSLYTSYIGKHKKGLVDSSRPEHHKVRVLELLTDLEETDTLQNWGSAKALLHKVGKRVENLPAPSRLISASILAFAPGSYVDWHEEILDNEIGWVVTLLNPSPNFRLHSGEETVAPPPWGAFVMDHRPTTSITNFSAPNTAHLLLLETRLIAGEG